MILRLKIAFCMSLKQTHESVIKGYLAINYTKDSNSSSELRFILRLNSF